MGEPECSSGEVLGDKVEEEISGVKEDDDAGAAQ